MTEVKDRDVGVVLGGLVEPPVVSGMEFFCPVTSAKSLQSSSRSALLGVTYTTHLLQ